MKTTFTRSIRNASFALPMIVLGACNTGDTFAPDTLTARASSAPVSTNSITPGYVYTLSNQSSGNAILLFDRAADGSLTAAGSVSTGGLGTGAGLGSQNALVASRNGQLLFAVNAGSNTISSFRFDDRRRPVLVSTVPSGGTLPISVTTALGLVYVVNAGGSGNIAGFRVDSKGILTPIAGSAQPLSSSNSQPAQIEFDGSDDRLIVTEKGTNLIDSYIVRANGIATLGTSTPSRGATPFGFAFRRNTLIVAEAFGGAANASTASSYTIAGVGGYNAVSASVPTTETAACWTVVTANGRWAYMSNTGSGTITGFAISPAGALTRLAENGESAVLGAGTAPADMALSTSSQYLYARNGGNRTISVVAVNADGSLTVIGGGITGLPSGTVGLLAR